MTAGVLFGVLPGLAVVSASGTLAATLSFLIARYAARDKVRACLDASCSLPASDAESCCTQAMSPRQTGAGHARHRSLLMDVTIHELVRSHAKLAQLQPT